MLSYRFWDKRWHCMSLILEIPLLPPLSLHSFNKHLLSLWAVNLPGTENRRTWPFLPSGSSQWEINKMTNGELRKKRKQPNLETTFPWFLCWAYQFLNEIHVIQWTVRVHMMHQLYFSLLSQAPSLSGLELCSPGEAPRASPPHRWCLDSWQWTSPRWAYPWHWGCAGWCSTWWWQMRGHSKCLKRKANRQLEHATGRKKCQLKSRMKSCTLKRRGHIHTPR